MKSQQGGAVMMAMARALLRAPLLLVGILVTMRVILVCVIREGSTPRVIQLDAFGLSWQGAPGGSAAPALLQPLHGRHLLPGCFVRSVQPSLGWVQSRCPKRPLLLGARRSLAQTGGMAEFRDSVGWRMRGQRGIGFGPKTRFWGTPTTQLANFWNSAP